MYTHKGPPCSILKILVVLVAAVIGQCALAPDYREALQALRARVDAAEVDSKGIGHSAEDQFLEVNRAQCSRVLSSSLPEEPRPLQISSLPSSRRSLQCLDLLGPLSLYKLRQLP